MGEAEGVAVSVCLDKKSVYSALPDHELVVSRGQEQVQMYQSQSAMELLANTLPYALAAKDNDALRAWLLYYARTCA